MKKFFFYFIIFTLLISCTNTDDNPTFLTRDDNGIILGIPLSGSLQNPAFSPDGKSIVFTRFVNGYNKEPSDLYQYNLGKKEMTILVADGTGNINLPGSAWVNGNIIYASTRDPHDEIYMIPENGDGLKEVKITVRSGKVAYEPTFSPDGQWTVFESHLLDVETDGIITKYKIDGSSAYIELTNRGDDCRQPNWSPANNKILYQQMKEGQWNIWTMNVDGSDKKQVTSNLGGCTDASFSTDGQFIVFSSDHDSKIANIYRVDIDGNNPVKLTEFSGYDGAPSISPDGKILIFESVNDDPDDSKGTVLVMVNL